MDENTLQNIHELDMARMERANKRLFILTLVLVILLVGSNIGWLIYESQYSVVETEVTQTNEDGYNNFIGNDGDIYNGESDDKNTEESP